MGFPKTAGVLRSAFSIGVPVNAMKANDQFTVKVANTMEEAIKLMEVGFEYHAEIEGNKLFRKRK
jgi:hypothetical protein